MTSTSATPTHDSDDELEELPTGVYARPMRRLETTERSPVSRRSRGRGERPAASPTVAANPALQERPAIAPTGATLSVIGRYLGDELSATQHTLELGRAFDFGSGTSELRDPYLDPCQARIVPGRLGFSVEDLGSKNGVFALARRPIAMRDGDSFRVGRQLVAFRRLGIYAAPARLGAPKATYWARLEIMRTPQSVASMTPVQTAAATVGRSEGLVRFADDAFVSRAHCRIEFCEGAVMLEDLQSSNGTYHRLRGRTLLPYGSVLLAGDTLFRVDCA